MRLIDFANIYISAHAQPHKRSWKEDVRRLEKWILPALGHRELADIIKPDIVQLHAGIGIHYPIQANRVLEQLSKMFTLAVDWEILTQEHKNPAKGVKRFRERDRLRFVSRDEMQAIFREINMIDSVWARGALLLLIFTGLRKNEVLKLKWSQVRGDRIVLPDSKNGNPIMQPLNKQAQQVLALLPQHGEWVIKGGKPGQPRFTIQKTWERVRRRAGVNDVTIHDLRRTVGAWLTESGTPLQIIQQVMNHQSLETTLVYARVSDKAKRKALESYGDEIQKLIGDAS